MKRAVVVAAALIALLPESVSAHASLVSSHPGAGEELRSAPGLVVLDFSEPIDTTLSRASVVAPDGARFVASSTSADEIQISLPTNLPGVYQVAWTTVSGVDGHTLSGSFRFGVNVSPGPAGEVAISALQGRDLALATARALELGALLLAIGLLLLRRLAPPQFAWARKAHLAYPLAVAFLAGSVVVLIEAGLAAGGPVPSAVTAYLTDGLPGYARVLRVGLECAALIVALIRPSFVLVPLLPAIVALAAAGHAAAVQPAAPAIAVDAIHLMSAAIWVGGILALAVTRPPGGWLGRDGRALLNRFSSVALIAFAITALTGLIQATEELSGPADLLTSSYGNVLGAKMLAIGAMVTLSFLAWRRIRAWPTAEAVVALLVIGASALLASFPIPPARLAQAEAERVGPENALSVPQPADFTLGGNAGSFLIGLSVRPARPGLNLLLIYMLPLRGEAAAAKAVIRLGIDGRAIAGRRCGPTCYDASAALVGGETVQAAVTADGGGTATFQIPDLPAADGSQLLQMATGRMDALHAFQITEILGPARVPLRTDYELEAPDRLHYTLATGAETIFVSGTRYSRDGPSDPWKAESTAPVKVPTLIWEQETNQGGRLDGSDTIDGVQTEIVTFSEELDGGPIWFRLWIDPQGLVRRAEMRAPGHFMDHHYFDFDGPISITVPTV